MGKVYHYHPDTKVFTGSSDAWPDPADPSKDMVPAHATTLVPPTGLSAYHSPVFVNGHWEDKVNYYGLQLWDTITAQPVDNTLDVGDALTPGTTPLDPTGLDYPKWDGYKWVLDTAAQNADQYATEEHLAVMHLEDALKLLADNEIRKTIPGAHILSQIDEVALQQYVLDMENYVDLLHKTGPGLIATKTVPEPTFPLRGDPSETNVDLFGSVNPGPAAGLQAVSWTANTQFQAGQLVYGPNGEGLFVVPSTFTSTAQLQTDLTQSKLISVMPQTANLRLAPVADIAALAALPAQDYAICKVTATGDEYVFNRGAVSGDVRDDNATGYWALVASPAVGQYRTYTGTIAGAGTADIVVGPQPFNPNFELVFVNGSCRVDSEYSIDWTTGTITLNQAMNVNDTWKVLVMS